MSDLRQSEIMAAVEAAVMIERDFLSQQAGPVALMLSKARAECAQAVAALVTVEPTDWKAIQSLQNDVQRYRDLLRWAAEIVAAGKDADAELTDLERDNLREALGLTESED